MSIPLFFSGSRASAWTPRNLFTAGEQGAWYDPSDLSTLFQDAAGTTPVTAVEQPVGLMLDKRFGAPIARRNLLTYTEQFQQNPWSTGSVTISANAAVAPDGTTTADLLYPASSGVTRWVYQPYSAASAIYTRSVYAKAQNKSILFVDSTGAGTALTYFNLGTGAVGTTASGYTASITSVGSGWYRCSVTNNSAAAFSFGAIYGVADADGSASVTANGTDGIYIWGAQFERDSTATAYQKVITGIPLDWTPGNHATQATAANRPTLSARVNLLTKTEDFSDSAWALGHVGIVDATKGATNAAVAPDGTTTADEISFPAVTGGNNFAVVRQAFTAATASYTASIYVKAKAAGDAGKKIAVWINDGSIGNFSFVTLTTDWQRVTVTESCTATATAYMTFGVVGSDNGGSNQDAFSCYVWGADLRVANESASLPAYQRVNTATDYDTSGFPPYLAFNGTNQFLSAGDVCDLLANDQTTISGSVMTGASGTVYAKSVAADAAGRFALTRDASQLTSLYAGPVVANASVADTNANPRVLTVVLSRSGGTNTIRANGAQIASASFTPENNNYNTGYRFLIGAYNNSTDAGEISLLSGRLYSLIVRGAATSAADIVRAESYVNLKSGRVY